MIFMLVISALYLIFAPFLIGIFTTEPVSLHAGILALRILGGGYIFFGWGMIISQAINGAGDTGTPTMLNFIFFWLIETPLAWLLALYLNWGQLGVYWSVIIAESLMAVAAIWVFKRGRWKLVKV